MTAPELDRKPFRPGFGSGGVPWYLMVLYLAFLVFFTWYVLEYQLPDYLALRAQGQAAPGSSPAAAEATPEPDAGGG